MVAVFDTSALIVSFRSAAPFVSIFDVFVVANVNLLKPIRINEFVIQIVVLNATNTYKEKRDSFLIEKNSYAILFGLVEWHLDQQSIKI